MKILEKAVSASGVNIQLEEWENEYLIGAYPIAQNSSKYKFIQKHEKFRLSIKTKNPLTDFDDLKTGKKDLKDFRRNFWNGEKDAWYLGLIEFGSDDWYTASRIY